MILVPHGEPVVDRWFARPIADVVRHLSQRAAGVAGRPVVVAVDGRSGSGKSTFAEVIRRHVVGSAVARTDDVAWWESFFDWDHLLVDGVLAPVRRGEEVSYRPPAWDRRQREGAIVVAAGTSMLIVEGVGASRRALGEWIDVAVWVQSDLAEARRRGIARDGATADAEAFWDDWEREETPFLDADRPWERAELVVCGTPELTGIPHDPSTEVLVGVGPSPSRGHRRTR